MSEEELTRSYLSKKFLARQRNEYKHEKYIFFTEIKKKHKSTFIIYANILIQCFS